MREKRKIKFYNGPAPRDYVAELLRYFSEAFGVEASEFFNPNRLEETCFGVVCVLYEGRAPSPRAVFSGNAVAVVVKGHVVLTPVLYEKVFGRLGLVAAVKASEQGVKAFLYGKDLLLESVLEIYPPVDSYVAVVDSVDGLVVGVARWDSGSRVFRNIFDIGLYLRGFG
ncbi:hypothetical protein TCELL_0931 [Thermogladius calderae 1633]|uniref:UPF0113 domain-containing protein n=1 Tax=Thermogladius calderae (strain DSM 22663 / VKM B-2946 / 1633) TaxID=1184251 RepID=I3TF17_THEC1|nr:hypothetical protein [Thermogladius calderae]AFK51355.1 hypothetical protein TCELL_0931 [Thermogladius calderae 1633]